MEYCERCEKEVETDIIRRKETYTVCGEDIEVDAHVRVCVECGEELFSEQLDGNTLLSAYHEYRRRHRLLFPHEIRKIREQYGLSQESFGKLLNWTDRTIRRYENGSVQSAAHNSLLCFLADPQNMKLYLKENENRLDGKQVEQLIQVIDDLGKPQETDLEMQYMEACFTSVPCEENGYKGFDYKKLCAMVLYFADQSTALLKTKLMKLLHYADMLFFKEYGVSMSGLRYVHCPYGPVPEHFDFLIGKLEKDHIAHIEVTCVDPYQLHQVVADQKSWKEVLSKEEIAVLQRVYDRFHQFGSAEISEYSHQEKGYISTKQGEIISYAYAKDISLK